MKFPKSFTFFLLLFLNFYTFAQDYWLRMPSPTGRILTRCTFVDTVFGWAAGDSGTIISTTNGGNFWSVQSSGIEFYAIDDIFFLNRRLGWAVSNDYFFNGTFMLKTSNGGVNWSSYRFPDTTVVIGSIYYTDSLNGFASGFSGKIFRTTNDGINWNECFIDTAGCAFLFGFPKNRIDFLNASTGFMCGGQMDIQGIIWRTTNSGLLWNVFCVTPEPLFDIKAINENKVIACGGDFEFGAITSTNYNNSSHWIYSNTELFGVARDLAFRTPQELWMPLSYAQAFAVHLDSGNTASRWIGIPAPDTTAPYAAQFVTPTFGFSFGSYGAIMKYNSAVIGIHPGSNIAEKFSLSQNFPNPFNPSTTISYFLAKREFVKITIYDLLGKQVKVLNEGNRPQGYNRAVFAANGLASGVYIYKIEAGDFSDAKKMVLIK